MNKLVTLFALLVMLSACGGAPTQSEAVETAQVQVIPEGAIPMHYDRHLCLEVELCDTIAARMLFDTGNTHLLLDSTFYAEKIGDRVPLMRSMFGGAGDGMESARMAMHTWRYRLGKEEMTERMAVVMNLRKIVGEKTDGMVGMTLMQGRRALFDYKSGYMQLLAAADSIPQNFVKISCTWLDDTKMRLVLPLELTFKDGTIFKGNFLVDTGMPDALSFNSTTANRLNLKERFADAVRRERAVGGVGGASVEYDFTVQTITVGGVALHDMQATWSENRQGSLADTRYDGLVGNALLENFDVIIDFSACAIYLRQNR